MSRSYKYPTKHQNGSNYYSHVQRMERAPSVLTEVPHYSQTHQTSVREDNGEYEHQQKQLNHDYGSYQQKQRIPEAHESIEVTERVTQYDKNGNYVIFEETIDVEADDFIEGKHKGFELCKWKTFKGHSGFRRALVMDGWQAKVSHKLVCYPTPVPVFYRC